MLCTMDIAGPLRRGERRLEQCLGYSAAEMRAARCSSSPTPTTASATDARRSATLRAAVPTAGFETRVRAKDGSWHWLRSSSTFAAGRGARLRPLDRRHRAEAGRGRTRGAARPRSRAGPQRRPHRAAEPPRARRAAAARDGAGAPRRVAALPGDHRHRPLQGLQRHQRPPRRRRGAARMRGRLGRGAARRGHARPLRRRGVPRRPARTARSSRAAEIVERLRAATRNGQTCSVGIACWDFEERWESLIDRADSRPLPGKGERPRRARRGRRLGPARPCSCSTRR